MTKYLHAETPDFRIMSHGGIACTIIWLRTGDERYLQGDEAQNFMDEVDCVYLETSDESIADEIVSYMCEVYFE